MFFRESYLALTLKNVAVYVLPRASSYANAKKVVVYVLPRVLSCANAKNVVVYILPRVLSCANAKKSRGICSSASLILLKR
jgi:hypothetical protein